MNTTESILLLLKTLGALVVIIGTIGAFVIVCDQIGRRRGIAPCDPAVIRHDHPDAY